MRRTVLQVVVDHLPDGRKPSKDLWLWQWIWLSSIFIPNVKEMRDIVVNKADLVIRQKCLRF